MKKELTVDDYYRGVVTQERSLLARAITLVESQRVDHQEMAQQLLKKLIPHSGKGFRIGLSGVPGAGKSTFIESLGKKLIKEGHKVAVLAIDPTGVNGGSILGDKTRMRDLACLEEAYIRPSPNGGKMGGVAQTTLESIVVCESAGYDIVIVETVGVGQSEMVVADMVDLFVMLSIPGAGDELQGIKRGILEVIDLLVINKADGERKLMAQQARQQFELALAILRTADHENPIPVMCCSSISGEGVDEIWQMVVKTAERLKQKGEWFEKRKQQQIAWLWRTIEQQLLTRFKNHSLIKRDLLSMERRVAEGGMTPFEAAEKLLEQFSN